MARARNDERLDRIYEYIKLNPGLKPGAIAKRLGYQQKIVDRALYQLNERGDLLWQEKDNGLYEFKRDKI